MNQKPYKQKSFKIFNKWGQSFDMMTKTQQEEDHLLETCKAGSLKPVQSFEFDYEADKEND